MVGEYSSEGIKLHRELVLYFTINRVYNELLDTLTISVIMLLV